MTTQKPESEPGTSPFHSGELSIQEKAGVDPAISQWARRAIRSFMPEQHRRFFSQLPFMVISARDESGRPWATILAGEPGFIESPDPQVLTLAAQLPIGDALHGLLTDQTNVGLLGIELHTRRRNRLNGVIERSNELGIRLRVLQSFGNCPQYINPRNFSMAEQDRTLQSVTSSATLTPSMADWIGSADTMFLASGVQEPHGELASVGMDASHRGGPAGFVRVLNESALVFPDYSGNNFFNTLGNLFIDPQIGMLFVDFEQGSTLQVTGRASIDWDSDALLDFAGAERLVQVQIDSVVQVENVLPIRWGRMT